MRAILTILFLSFMGFQLTAAEPAMLDTQELAVVYDEALDQTARQLLKAYPGIRQELEAMFQWPLDFRPTLVLINDEKKFQQLAGHELVVAYALPKKNVVVIDYSKMNTSPFTLQTTFQHELCHLMLHDHIKDNHLPRWLDEGICQWASDGLADIIMETKRALLPAAILSDTYLELAKLAHQFPRDKNAIILAYEQSKSGVEYMRREYGQQGILDLLELLRQGYDFESAFKMRFAITFDTFEDQWRGDLKENISWFTYLSTHLYEFLFVSAALLTVMGFVRKIIRRRAYSAQEDDDVN
jgi:hypothetical protein